MSATARSTITEYERAPGRAGAPPTDEHVEIQWARCDGRDVVVKAARNPHRSRLRREAEVLQRIADAGTEAPCAVDFLELTEGADHTELVTVRHGTVTLAEVGLLSPPERTEALVSFCRVIDRLHRIGWTHGSIDATHVLVDPGSDTQPVGSDQPGREVRLCSLADAEQLPGSDGDTALAEDRQALGTVVLEALEAPGGFGSGRERRRYERAAQKARKRLAAARGLHDGATVAAVLSDTIGRSTVTRANRPASRGRRRARDRSPKEPPQRAGRWRTWLVGIGVAACICAGAALAQAYRSPGETTSACMVEVGGESHRCADVTVERNIATVGGRGFELGGPEDSLLVGDWDCDGTGTAVLLESASGRLFHFDGWSTASNEVTGDQIGAFDGATGLRSTRSCGYPEVELADGSTVTPLDRSQPASAAPRASEDDDQTG